jgi:hypothetical protein
MSTIVLFADQSKEMQVVDAHGVLIDQPFAASDALTLFLESIENII